MRMKLHADCLYLYTWYHCFSCYPFPIDKVEFYFFSLIPYWCYCQTVYMSIMCWHVIKWVKVFSVNHCCVTSNSVLNFLFVYHSMQNMKSLQELHISSNQLTELPEAVTKITSLTKLNVASNKLTSFPERWEFVYPSGQLWNHWLNFTSMLMSDSMWFITI